MLRLRRLATGLAALVSSPAALAHNAEHETAIGWTFDPAITVPLAILLLVFLTGRRRLARRSRVDRRGQWWFLGGWLVLTIALVSPLHEGGERSFTLHMIEHEIIMLAATLMIALAGAGGTLAWGLPEVLRRALGGGWKAPLTGLWRRLTDPLTATIVQASVLWAWHAPALFDRALASPGWHAAQHLSFILASLAFWCAMLDSRRGGPLLGAFCLFLTSLVEGALGALMALSGSAWYAAYRSMNLSGIGLDPLSDQQLAGLVMWIPGGLVHGAMALLLLYRWLERSGGRHALSRD